MCRHPPATRLPTPETALSLCAGMSGNGGQGATVAGHLQCLHTRQWRAGLWQWRAGRNPTRSEACAKQIRIPNDKMTKTNTLKIRCFCHWSILISVIVSYFVLRISIF
jgi:hypothetical protein